MLKQNNTLMTVRANPRNNKFIFCFLRNIYFIFLSFFFLVLTYAAEDLSSENQINEKLEETENLTELENSSDAENNLSSSLSEESGILDSTKINSTSENSEVLNNLEESGEQNFEREESEILENRNDLNTTVENDKVEIIAPEVLSEDPTDFLPKNHNLENSIEFPRKGLKNFLENLENKTHNTEEERKKAQKENLEQINQVIKGEIDTLKEQLKENKNLRNELFNVQKTSDEYLETINKYEKNQKKLETEISQKEAVIQENQKTIEQLSQSEMMKNYLMQQNTELKQALQNNEAQEVRHKFIIFYSGVGIFIIFYLIKFFLKIKFHKKYRHQFTYFDVLWFFLLFTFLVWFFFYIRPEMIIIVFFLASALVIINKDIIVSLIASLLIVNEYQVGEKIRIDGQEGVIITITPLKVVVKNVDEYNYSKGENRRIPNLLFLTKEVVRIKKKLEKKDFFRIVLNREYELDIFQLLNYIEQEILQKNIITKMKNQLTGDEVPYDIEYHYNDDGDPVIEIVWKESKEKSRRIKKKIMAYVNSVIYKDVADTEAVIESGGEKNSV